MTKKEEKQVRKERKKLIKTIETIKENWEQERKRRKNKAQKIQLKPTPFTVAEIKCEYCGGIFDDWDINIDNSKVAKWICVYCENKKRRKQDDSNG